MTSLFISYSRKDMEAARKLTEAFKEQNFDFWIDWEGIPPTVDWWKEVQKGIEEADIFLFLISPDSAKSKVCRQEIEHAVKNGKRLIPAVVRDVQADEVPAELRALNWIFFRENDDFDVSFSKLVTAIKTDYAWVQAHRELQVKALEWQRSNHENSLLLRGKELQDAEFQLATNSSKEPHPTDLQREYVLNSRQASDRQRRITTSIAIAAVIALAALAIFGFVQAGSARREANGRATAQANAEMQRDIAVARQLVAEAQSINTTRHSQQIIAILLSIRSLQMSPSIDAAQILQSHTLISPTRSIIHDNRVDSVAFSPNGKWILSVACDTTDPVRNVCIQGTVRIWDAATGNKIAQMAHGGLVGAAAFSPDSNYIVTGSDDKTARVWETATGKEIARMSHADVVRAVAFSPDGKYVVSGSWDDTARVWEAATGKEIVRMTLPDGIDTVAFSHDGKYLVTGSGYQTATIWEVATGMQISHMSHDKNKAGSIVLSMPIAFSPDDQYVVSGSGVDNTARVWETVTGKEIARMTHEGVVSSVAVSPDGKYVVSGSWDNTARVWETVTGTEITRVTHDNVVNSVAFSPDGRYVASGSWDSTARVWEAATGKEVAQMIQDGGVPSVAFSPDGQSLVSGGDKIVRIWKPFMKVKIRVTDADFVNTQTNQYGRYVWISGIDNTVRVSEVATGKEIARMRHEDRVRNVAFSPDGKYVVSCSDDMTVRVWEANTGTEVMRVTLREAADSAAFSHDGKFVVASSGSSKTVHVWEVATGTEVARILTEDTVRSAVFLKDDKYVATVNQNNVFRVWLWQPEDLINHACADLPRNLSRDEWNFYIGTSVPYQAICPRLPIEPETTPTPSPEKS